MNCLEEAMTYDLKESGNKMEDTLWNKICQIYPSKCPFCGSKHAKITTQNLSCRGCGKIIISYIQPEEKEDKMLERQEFKSLRHSFYKLGKQRNISILVDLGKLTEGDEADHEDTKALLTQLVDEGRAYDLIQAIEYHEEEIQKEKDAML